ncbi:hypothetical protein [Novosphingobium sp. 9U]|uniref:hypothetical protein n=1 Tax=Novosphingobium sp. 9U TaxID=2653158 RepID=UPI001358BF35|nr:hypothetical protein [Novosphingobium sp. 9U]
MFDQALILRLKTLCRNVYLNEAPERYSLPCVIVSRIDVDPTIDLDGWDGTATSIYRIDTYAASAKDARALAVKIMADFKQWRDPSFQALDPAGITDVLDKTTVKKLYSTRMTWQVFGPLI